MKRRENMQLNIQFNNLENNRFLVTFFNQKKIVDSKNNTVQFEFDQKGEYELRICQMEQKEQITLLKLLGFIFGEFILSVIQIIFFNHDNWIKLIQPFLIKNSYSVTLRDSGHFVFNFVPGKCLNNKTLQYSPPKFELSTELNYSLDKQSYSINYNDINTGFIHSITQFTNKLLICLVILVLILSRVIMNINNILTVILLIIIGFICINSAIYYLYNTKKKKQIFNYLSKFILNSENKNS